MKNEKHPIDDLFQRGLNQHAVPPPMHIWERIEESRSRRHRSKLVFLRQKFTIISSAAAVLLLGVWLGWSDGPTLGSFPLNTGTEPLAQLEQLPDKIEMPAHQAGILPDVPSIIKEKKNTKTQSSASDVTQFVEYRPQGVQLSTIQDIKGIPAESSTDTKSTPESPDLQLPVSKRPEVLASASAPRSAVSNSKATSIPMLLDLPIQLLPETGCARFSEGRPAYFLALTGGPIFSNRTFRSRSGEDDNFAELRATTEIPRSSYSAGARLSLVFPWGGAIRSGIDYTRINEQLVYRNSKVRQVTITEILGPDGNVIGTDTIISTADTILRFNNRHRLVSIPLQIGYEVRYNKVTVAANAGVNINLSNTTEGSYLSANDQIPTRFDNNDSTLDPVYKTRVGLSWQFSLGIHYQLNERLDLMAEPFMRYYSASFTRNDYPLSQKYLVGGVGVGLRVLL